MPSLTNHEPATSVGRFNISLEGQIVTLTVRLYLADGTLTDSERPTFIQGFKTQVRATAIFFHCGGLQPYPLTRAKPG